MSSEIRLPRLILFLTLAWHRASCASVSEHLSAGSDEDANELARTRRAACSEGDCKNGGICWPGAVTSSTPPCLCPEAYTGTYCTVRIDFCATTSDAGATRTNPCQNGGTCSNTNASPWYHCSCVPGYTGTDCEINIDDCASKPCANGLCSDLVNDYSCSCFKGWEGRNCNINHNDCPTGACLNGGRCIDGNGTFTCDCSRIDFQGATCSSKIDDCASSPCQHGGRCTDGVRSFTCDCSATDFNGPNCQSHIDDCASKPCINGLCTDLVRNYSCSCFTGWEGRSCSVNTDYCLSGPCQNGGVCSDGNSTFSCDCSRVDFQGDTCSSKIDDCASRPCQHGGRCIDGVRSYTCDCSATDFYGSNCQSRIDDCASNPCSHNATCTDGLRDFSCSCFSGYSGKTCSVDVQDCSPNPCEYKGACLERSNQALYLVENSSLPAPFNDSFSYALAAGFVCLCPEGTYGDTCSINPNDCLDPATNRSVCAHASNCTDGLASFTCHCLPGYEGPTCSVEIDECERFGQPCQNGAVCKDLVADYACTGCPAEFGGKNCSVKLTGCDSSPCQNNATCEPLLLRELPSPDHGYRCTCKPGWSGPQCNETTLASFNGTSSFSANFTTTADCTFELSFRTSLAHFDLVRLSSHWGDIRVGAHDSSLVLLFFNASSSVIGRAAWPISDSLASTDWLTLSISLTNGSATLSRSESGVSQMPGAQLVDGLSDSFRPNSRMSVRVGGESGSGIDGGGFRGCVRDLRLVTNDSTLVATETTVESSNATWGVCSRSVQCGSPSPCEAKTSSMCSDVWNDFVCHCAADFGGLRCSVELPSFSLGVGGSVSSARFASAAGVSSVYGGDSWTIELRLMTLSRGAFLLLLGDPSDSATTPRLLATIDASGRLSAQVLYGNGSEIVALTSSNSVATGEYVSVKISLSISDRSLSLSVSSSVGSASLSSASPLPQLSGQLIIGGFSGLLAAPAPPPIESSGTKGRSRRSLPALPTSISSTLSTNLTAFRGIIASPKLNGLKPLILGSVESNVTDLLPGAVAASETESITDGVVNEDVCTNWEPCQKNATCTNVFYNKFSCECEPGWRSADCSVRDHCVPGSEDCPTGAQCVNLEPRGYECRTTATFQSSTKLRLSASRFNEALTSLTGWARTRELNFRLLSMTNSDGRQLFVEAKSGHLRVSLDNKHAMSDFSIATGFPFTFDVRFFTERRLELSAKFNGTDAATTFSESHDFAPLTLDSAAVVVLGDSGFKGCLGNVRLNGYLVPLVNRSLPSDTPGFSWSATDADSIISPTPGCHGDVVCKTGVCQNSGRCSDMWNKYVCDCKDGFSGPTCSAVASVPSVGAIIGMVAGVVVAAGIIVAIVLVAKFTTLFRPSASSDLQSQSKLDPTTGVRVGHLRSKSAKPVPQEVFF
ncbi:hypothetical protein BOX15_Mlig000039g3 [Macrostomum lignano]|uniref:EGF-like domain-containing protein n=1 Tax=Macrostomum lignano TaxID=282301 RepID=A0A267F7L4_9PLAT|nr:hypothetical protein BOX15_Mlig000039g3 [Macrostomum lignano]